MYALRSFARTVPRAALRVARPVAPRTTALLTSKPQPKSQSMLRTFSTSIWRREPAGESDQVLSAKLNQERQIELENENDDEIKAGIDDFMANSSFKVEDKSGTHQVVLSRQFGNETIKLEFSVADMEAAEDEFDPLEQDNAFDDEELTADTSGGKRTINQSGTRGGKIDVAPEDSIAPSDGEDAFDQGSYPTQYPLSLNITITKPGQGATLIQAEVINGAVEVERVSYYPKAELLEPKSSGEVREAATVYEGPPFSNLDADLQAMILQYLEERGIDAELAEFLPRYVEYKEQREYVQWLDSLRKFVDA